MNDKEIDELAHLARLSLKPGDRDAFRQQLDPVLREIEKIKGIDVSSVEPTSHVHGVLGMPPVSTSEHYPCGKLRISANAPSRSELFRGSLKKG